MDASAHVSARSDVSRTSRVGAASWLLVLAVGLAADAIYLASGPVAAGATDFHQFHDSANAWIGGEPMYRPVPQGDRVVFNLNPPHFHLLILPFAALPVAAGFAVWMAASIACLMSVLWQLIPRWFAGLREPLWPMVMLAWIFVTPVTGAVLVTGAPVWILLPLVYAAWQAHRGGRLATAGLLVGVLASLKLFLLLLLPWFLLRREWKSLTVAGLTFVTAFLAGSAVFGLRAYADWIGAIRSGEGWSWGQLNGSMAAIAARAFADTPYWAPLTTDAPAWPIWGMLAVGVLVVTAYHLRRQPVDRGWPLVLTTAFLVNPLSWIYYTWWLAPFAFVRPRGWLGPAGAALLTVPPWLLFAAQPSSLATLTLSAAYVWGFFCLWLSYLNTREHRGTVDAAA